MTAFLNYSKLPEPIQKELLVLEEFIGALDGQTTDEDGTIDAEDAVVAFNAIVEALSSPQRQD